ncbi:amidohydrolase family protein [Acidobacteria bacterium AH-259-D05]|nr:amidohydrolase family protein [Acidobacteria bacterium AH-259-D05]
MKSRNWYLTLLPAILLLLVFCQPAEQPEPASQITVIEGATVIEGVADTPIEDAILVIEGDTIRNLGRRGTIQPPANAEVIQAAGKTIMPALFNLHGHIAMAEGMERSWENYSRERIQRDANIYLYYGVTHAVSLGMDREPMIGFQADQRAGRVGGARIYSAGIGFASKDGWQPAGVVDINRPTTPEEARTLVQQEAAKPVDVIKIWVDDRQGELPKITPELYGAIIDEAHKHNIKVLAHMYYLEDAKELMRRGVDALAHSVRDREVDEEYLQLAREAGITQLTTLVGHFTNVVYADGPNFLDDPGLPLLFPASVLETVASKEYQERMAKSPNLPRSRRNVETAMKNAAKVAAAGIPIAVGTDSSGAGRFQGLWEHREMELLVEAGLTPMEAIQAATVNGAKFLGVDDRYGSLAPGKVADFIVLNADPLADITHSRQIDAVWMNGQRVNRAALASSPPTR